VAAPEEHPQKAQQLLLLNQPPQQQLLLPIFLKVIKRIEILHEVLK